MLASLRLLLLCVLVLAPLPAWASAADARAGASAAVPSAPSAPAAAEAGWRAEPTIEADRGPLDEGVRAGERAELLTTLAHVLATGVATPRSTAGVPAPAARRAVGWSDVVQCRRWSGAQLLRWATPPPTRG